MQLDNGAINQKKQLAKKGKNKRKCEIILENGDNIEVIYI